MALTADSSRALRSRQAQRELVEAIESAPTSEQETNWLEWKRGLDLSAKATHATIAKAVLGFANRSPDVAVNRPGVDGGSGVLL